jgi:hypothetical protein
VALWLVCGLIHKINKATGCPLPIAFFFPTQIYSCVGFFKKFIMKIQTADKAFWNLVKIKYRKARFSWQRARFFYVKL